MHIEGKINNKYPIFNDLLTFMWCKMKLCAKDVLINILKQYYQSSEIMKARDVMYQEFPATPEDNERRIKHRKTEDALNAIYVILQNLPVDDPPVFAALNLNNIPYVELKNVDGAALMWQQGQLKDQLQNMVEAHTVIKAQLASIIDHLQNGNVNTASSKPAEVQAPNGVNTYREVLRANLPAPSQVVTQRATPPAPQPPPAQPRNA